MNTHKNTKQLPTKAGYLWQNCGWWTAVMAVISAAVVDKYLTCMYTWHMPNQQYSEVALLGVFVVLWLYAMICATNYMAHYSVAWEKQYVTYVREMTDHKEINE
jgi:hypothetical protein